MLTINKIESLNELTEMKEAYFAQTIAPLDGMWHFGFVPMAKHFAFHHNKKLVGFCCINDDGYLLQFYLVPEMSNQAKTLFTLIAQQHSSVIGKVKGAFVSTAEPNYLSLCLDNSASFKVNAMMYQHQSELAESRHKLFEMQAASAEQLTTFVNFAVNNIGAPEQWLNHYYGNLIARNELFGYWKNGELFAAGECRLFDDYQTQYADLGMIVSQTVRGQGLGKKVFSYLSEFATNKGLTAICSTESNNIAAQKAIAHAGFNSTHRIVQFEFSPE